MSSLEREPRMTLSEASRGLNRVRVTGRCSFSTDRYRFPTGKVMGVQNFPFAPNFFKMWISSPKYYNFGRKFFDSRKCMGGVSDCLLLPCPLTRDATCYCTSAVNLSRSRHQSQMFRSLHIHLSENTYGSLASTVPGIRWSSLILS